MQGSFILAVVYGGIVLALQGKWEQCGGELWHGGTSCSDGWTCQIQNPYYSQCLPAPSGSSSTAAVASPTGDASSGHDAKAGDLDDLDDETCDSEPDPEPENKSQQKAKSGVENPPVVDQSSSSSSSSSSQNPPVVNQAGSGSGTNLATTTNYGVGDGPGACGCSGGWQAPGAGTVMTAAASFPIYGDGYCGAGCGKCFKLTNMGYGPTANSGASPDHKGDSIIVMITNSCPVQGNEQWCSSPNQYGYTGHFDIGSSGASPNGWGNVVVSYEPVGCGQANGLAGSQMQGSLLQNYAQCKCSSQRPASSKKRSTKARLDGGSDIEEFLTG